ncbi:MAG: MarR family transcriptional regulator [Acidimicrobiia bacterium]
MSNRSGNLNPTERRAWRTVLHSSTHLLDRLDSQLKTRHGVPLADYDVLSNLAEAEGRRLRMSDLSEQTLFSPSRLTHRVGRLEDAGLVTRHTSSEDGRGVFAHLTAEGRNLHRRLAATHIAGVRTYLLDALTAAEQQQLADLLIKVLDGMQVQPQPPL